jgi:hypothetical protein
MDGWGDLISFYLKVAAIAVLCIGILLGAAIGMALK